VGQRRAVRVDVIYTVLNRLGVVPLAVFALLAPVFMELDGCAFTTSSRASSKTGCRPSTTTRWRAF
jgi:hypothetical protein